MSYSATLPFKFNSGGGTYCGKVENSVDVFRRTSTKPISFTNLLMKSKAPEVVLPTIMSCTPGTPWSSTVSNVSMALNAACFSRFSLTKTLKSRGMMILGQQKHEVLLDLQLKTLKAQQNVHSLQSKIGTTEHCRIHADQRAVKRNQLAIGPDGCVFFTSRILTQIPSNSQFKVMVLWEVTPKKK